jgi:hypothetical protein
LGAITYGGKLVPVAENVEENVDTATMENTEDRAWQFALVE